MVNTLPKNGYNQFQDADQSEYTSSFEANPDEYIDLSEITNSQVEFQAQTRQMETIAITGEISNDGNSVVKAREGYLAELDFQAEEYDDKTYMPDLIKQTMNLLIGTTPRKIIKRNSKKMTNHDLIRLESEIGRTLFGEIPEDHNREFFCLDVDTWVWHEEWKDLETAKLKSHTIRYEVHQNGVVKVQDGGANYAFIEDDELKNLSVATKLYKERTLRDLYKRDPKTGKVITSSPAII